MSLKPSRPNRAAGRAVDTGNPGSSNADKSLHRLNAGVPTSRQSANAENSSAVGALPLRPSSGTPASSDPANVDNVDLTFPEIVPKATGAGTWDARLPPGPSAETLRRIQAARRPPSRHAGRRHSTLSERTSAAYLNRCRTLLNRYKRELGVDPEADNFDAKEFVIWLLSIKPTVRASTWRVYRQAVYYALQGRPEAGIDGALMLIDKDIIESDDRVGQTQSDNARLSRRTSVRKKKSFAQADLDKVMAFLRYRSRSKYAPLLIDFLVASIYTGLRPVEWQATDFQKITDPATKEIHVWFYILDAKATNQCGSGVTRTLDLSELPTLILNAIRRNHERGLAWCAAGKYEDMIARLSKLLYQVGEEIFPRRKVHHALYSCRHQFIANAKSLMPPEMVSAMSGRSMTKTAREHYGKKKSAWAPDQLTYHARPIAGEVATIKKSIDLYQERRRQLKAAGLSLEDDPEE